MQTSQRFVLILSSLLFWTIFSSSIVSAYHMMYSGMMYSGSSMGYGYGGYYGPSYGSYGYSPTYGSSYYYPSPPIQHYWPYNYAYTYFYPPYWKF